MANHSAAAIANEFLRRRGDSAWPQQAQLHKLAYIAHGWNLAINDEALIEERPEAWDNGPVFRSLWNHIRDNGYRGENCTLVDPDTNQEISEQLSESERAIVDHVWRKYGHLSGHQLSRITHEPGTPWSKAYFDRGRNSKLDNDEVRDHYTAMALAGREAAAG